MTRDSKHGVTAHKAVTPWADRCASYGQPHYTSLGKRERGRRCAHEGCCTILSIYNPSRWCFAHGDEERKRAATPVRYTPEGLRVCSICGVAKAPTTEFFHARAESKDGLKAECKDCANRRRKDVSREVLKGETKTCRRCGQTKTIIECDTWNRDNRRRDGWASNCRACESEVWKQRRTRGV